MRGCFGFLLDASGCPALAEVGHPPIGLDKDLLRQVPSGVYLYRLTIGAFTEPKALTLLK